MSEINRHDPETLEEALDVLDALGLLDVKLRARAMSEDKAVLANFLKFYDMGESRAEILAAIEADSVAKPSYEGFCTRVARHELKDLKAYDKFGLLPWGEESASGAVELELVESDSVESEVEGAEKALEVESTFEKAAKKRAAAKKPKIKDETKDKAEPKPPKIASLDDALSTLDSLGVLEVDPTLFKHEFTRSREELMGKTRSASDFIAQRRANEDASMYTPLFLQVHEQLSSGARKLKPFSLKPGVSERDFYLLDGGILFVEKIDGIAKDRFGKLDGRTHLIFENGTHSRMKLRSLEKRLIEKRGKFITHLKAEEEASFFEHFGKGIKYELNGAIEVFNEGTNEEELKKSGEVYILAYVGEGERVGFVENLHKIGMTTLDTKERLANSRAEATYINGKLG